jgi:cyclopropane-fatty-acyl-phospholipid synthase
VKAKVQALGLESKIEVLNKDYRLLGGTYDKLVSIEMIEAIGFKYFDLFFEKCNALLKVGGSFLLQAITINDQSYASAKNEIDFIKKYIFPGGCLPSIQAIFDSVARKTTMQLLHARELGHDYALTLKAWRDRFNYNKKAILELGYSCKFIRMWEFYFCYCIAAFKQGHISDFHLLWKKRL